MYVYRVRHKNNPLRKLDFIENGQAYFAVFFHQLMSRYICETHKFYYDILSRNKTMAVRSARYHFVSEQQLISSITRNRYCFNYCKRTRHVDAININSDSMFEMSSGCFLHVRSLLLNDNIAALIWSLRHARSDHLHTFLQFRKCRSALVRNIGTRSRASQSIHDIPVD